VNLARHASFGLTLLVLALGVMTFRVVRDGEAALAESDAAFRRGDLANAVLFARRAAIAYAPGAPHTRAALARLRAVAVGSEGVGDAGSARRAGGAIRSAAVETHSLTEPYAAERAEADQALARLSAVPVASDPEVQARAVERARRSLQTLPGPSPLSSVLLVLGFGAAALGLVLVALRGLTREGRLLRRGFALGVAVFALGVACWTFAAYRA
jgi:hypothetical protein